MRNLKMREVITRERSELFFVCPRACFQHNKSVRCLAPAVMRKSYNGDFLNGWMSQYYSFNLHRRNVLTPTDDYILQAVANLRVSTCMDHRPISCVEPTAAHDFRRCLRFSVIALHHGVPTNNNFT